LLHWIDLGSFFIVAVKIFVLAIFVVLATSSIMGIHTLRFSANIDQAIRFLLPSIPVFVLLPMVIDHLNGCARAHDLGIAVKFKLWDKLRWYFQVCGSWFGSELSSTSWGSGSTNPTHEFKSPHT
jgi:hypothetical protein